MEFTKKELERLIWLLNKTTVSNIEYDLVYKKIQSTLKQFKEK
tara:strand:- start:714 stop:842 length:129 start_codon:yes stop_codon:yes gene_type:complete